MARQSICHLLAIIPWALGSSMVSSPLGAVAQSPPAQSPPAPGPPSSNRCPPAVLSQLRKHVVRSGETLASIAQQYGLSTATLQGMNPRVRYGSVMAGMTIVVPPYNGILVAVPTGQTLKAVAETYRLSLDVLFEVNGCQLTPKVAFVPGVTWSPSVNSGPSGIAPLRPVDPSAQPSRPVNTRDIYPLPQPAPILGAYGWRINTDTRKLQFYSGVDLQAAAGTPVYAASSGIVIFAGERGPSGQLVIVRHTQGKETRYGRLSNVKVKVGQQIPSGHTLGEVEAAAQAQLRFEVRYRSSLGWVAHDPQPYLQSLQK